VAVLDSMRQFGTLILDPPQTSEYIPVVLPQKSLLFDYRLPV
jgi:hypothetical protein